MSTTPTFTGTIDGTQNTRACAIFTHKENAVNKIGEMNAKAEAMGLKARYQLTDCDTTWLAANEKAKQ